MLNCSVEESFPQCISNSFSDDDMDDYSDSSRDEDDFLTDPFRNEVKGGNLRTKTMDPICSKLDQLLNSNALDKSSMFFLMLKNAVEYVEWLLHRQSDTSLQFQWDDEIIEFIETLEYHGHENVINLLRGPGHLNQGKGGIKTFNWANWNWPLPGRTTRKKNCSGYTTDDGIHSYLLSSFLKLASSADSKVAPLHEDDLVKVIPVFIAKDAMQIKPGFSFDENQKRIIGSTLKIDYNYVSENPFPDTETLKAHMVQECEVLCITSADKSISVPYAVNHLTKSMSGEETEAKMVNEAKQTEVCLHHLENGLISIENSVITNSEKCNSVCSECTQEQSLCDVCMGKGVFSVNPLFRPCNYCLKNGIKCIKLAVLGISMDSESRNQSAQDIFKEKKLAGERDSLKYCETFPDAVHVGKRKRQSFANWFLFVNGERTNLVQLRTLRNDPFLKNQLSKVLRLNSVRNRDRQDVESLVEIGSKVVRSVLSSNVHSVTHTIVPEKFRVTKDNTIGTFSSPFAICIGNFGLLYVSDVAKGKVFGIRASHYPAEVETIAKGLSNPVSLTYHDEVLYVAECDSSRIAMFRIKGTKLLRPDSMTAAQLKASLQDIGVPNAEIAKMRKVELQALLSSKLDENQYLTGSVKGNDHVQLSQEIKNPSSLTFTSNDTMAVATLSGQIYIVQLRRTVAKISGNIIQKTVLPWKSLQGSICLNKCFLVSSNSAEGGIWKLV